MPARGSRERSSRRQSAALARSHDLQLRRGMTHRHARRELVRRLGGGVHAQLTMEQRRTNGVVVLGCFVVGCREVTHNLVAKQAGAQRDGNKGEVGYSAGRLRASTTQAQHTTCNRSRTGTTALSAQTNEMANDNKTSTHTSEAIDRQTNQQPTTHS